MPLPRLARARAIFRILRRAYPKGSCQLKFRSPFQLLTATILSAQCTDQKVNQATPALFRRYPAPGAMARAPIKALEGLIHSLGLYHAKARSLKGAARMILEKYKGKVPRKMEELVDLPGVGRKTANVVLYNAFGLPGLAVDTHVLRVGKRLGLFQSRDPVKVEQALQVLLPPERWGEASHLLIWHGRQICKARNPACPTCPVRKLCRYFIRLRPPSLTKNI